MKIAVRAAASTITGFLFFALALFVPAGTLNYWQAWVFIGIFFVVGTGPSIYWGMKKPEVLQRRMTAGPTAETRPAQKIIMVGIYLWIAALLVVSALDHRFGWSDVPTAVTVLGDVLVVAGLAIAVLVVQQNSYAGATITVDADQPLISNGLYGVVRHPMYFGMLLMGVGMPLALGSYWGLVAFGPGLVVLGLRILDEEQMLTQELDGYHEYTQKVHHRLVPYVW